MNKLRLLGFVTSDLHFLRETRAMLNEGIIEAHYAQVRRTRGREFDVCSSVDATLYYTAEEHAGITLHLQVKKTCNLLNGP